MSKIKQNIIMNYIGRGWISLIGIIFIPIYINILGVESYGVIGFQASLAVALTFLDFGISQTLVREAAKSSISKKDKKEFFLLVGSIEYIYWLIALLTQLIFFMGASWIAQNWLKTETITVDTLSRVITIMGFVVALKWVGGIYRSILIGVQDQVWLNYFDIIISTLRSLGVIGALIWISSTLEGFFIYQAVLAILEILILRQKVWVINSMNCLHISRFYLHHVLKIWKFAGSVAVISIAGTLVSQMDKLILPGLISLKAYGYYMVANVIGLSVKQLIIPVAVAYRPVFANLVAQGKEIELIQKYHQASQTMAVLTIPIAMTLAIYSPDILFLWTGDIHLVTEVSTVMSLLAIGTMFNGLVNLPYSILLAYGWLKPALIINVLSAFILVPLLIYGVSFYGIVAVGWIWLFLNLLYITINISIIHSRYLTSEGVNWYKHDIIPVLLASFFVSYFISYIFSEESSTVSIVFKITIACLLTFLSAALSVKYTRLHLITLFHRVVKSG